MSNKAFVAIIATLVLVTCGFLAFNKKGEAPEPPRPGIEQADKGQRHVAEGEVPYGGPEPPTSGDHSPSPAPWQAYEQEIPDMTVIHNMEHGGIYISYRPDLPPEQIAQIKALFFQPFSRQGFSPTKAIMAPRSANESPIIMSSWKRSLKFDAFDEEKMVEYYLRNIGKSPEPTAN